MNISIAETSEKDLQNIQKLWADGDVMKFVGFPDGLHQSIEEMEKWYQRICDNRPRINHYSIYQDDAFCGETFYRIDVSHNHAACLDIKLFSKARGRGIASKALNYAIKHAFMNGASRVWVDPDPKNIKALALYERLGFERCEQPDYLKESRGEDCVYMVKNRTE